MVDEDEGIATPMPSPLKASARITTTRDEPVPSVAKIIIENVMNMVPAIVDVFSPILTAAYPASGEQIANMMGRAIATPPTSPIE